MFEFITAVTALVGAVTALVTALHTRKRVSKLENNNGKKETV